MRLAEEELTEEYDFTGEELPESSALHNMGYEGVQLYLTRDYFFPENESFYQPGLFTRRLPETATLEMDS